LRGYLKNVYQSGFDGLIVISGVSYRGGSEIEIREHKDKLYKIIIEQLEKCPDSIIIFDEAHDVHPETLAVFQEFMDKSEYVVNKHTGKKVLKSKAMIGIVSDYAKEGAMKNLNTYDELEKFATKYLNEIWGDQYWKFVELLDYKFIFKPLSDDDLKLVLKSEMKIFLTAHDLKNGKLEYDQETENFMVKKANDDYKSQYGRGIYHWVNQKFYVYVRNEIKKKMSTYCFIFR